MDSLELLSKDIADKAMRAVVAMRPGISPDDIEAIAEIVAALRAKIAPAVRSAMHAAKDAPWVADSSIRLAIIETAEAGAAAYDNVLARRAG